ncbi:hypothetical protein BH09ACT3_BH09ACT3_02050 [soil metagenome]
MRRGLALAALVLLLAGGAVPALAAEGTITFGIRPTGDDRSRFEFTVDPGALIEDSVEVLNLSDETILVEVYAVDAVTAADGSFALQPPDKAAEDGGSWVSFGNGRSHTAEIPAHEQIRVPFTVAVPDQATPGDHPAAVVAAISDAESDGLIQLQHRTATRLLVHVSGELEPALEMTDLAYEYRPQLNPFDGTLVTSFTLVNSGNVALRATARTTATGLFRAWEASAVAAQTDLILPGASLAVMTRLTGVPAWGILEVDVTVATAVDDDAPRPDHLPRPDGAGLAPAPSWTILAILVLLASAIWFVRDQVRRSTSRFEKRVEQRVREELHRDADHPST